MNHDAFVAAAYAVFALALGWDYLAPRLRLSRALRAIAQRARREQTRKSGAPQA